MRISYYFSDFSGTKLKKNSKKSNVEGDSGDHPVKRNICKDQARVFQPLGVLFCIVENYQHIFMHQ